MAYDENQQPQRRHYNTSEAYEAQASRQQRSGNARQGDISRYSDRSRYTSQQRQRSQSQSSGSASQDGQSRPSARTSQGGQASAASRASQGGRPRPSTRASQNGQSRPSARSSQNGQSRPSARASQNGQSRGDARSSQSGQGHYQSHVHYADAQWYNEDQIRQNASPYNDPSRYSVTAGSYNSMYDQRMRDHNHETARESKVNGPLIALIVIGVIIVAALLWFFVIPKPFEVTVNGKEVTMNPGTTVASLVQEGHVHPASGNLVAVDGSLITAGEGEPFSATIDGSPAAGDTKLAKDMVVEIGNGGDITEEYTATEEVIPFDTINDDTSFEAYWTGSIHELKDGVDGVRTIKTGTISGKTVSEDTVPAVAGGYHNYTVQTDQPVVALTFDDGPWPETTHEILDILEQNGAKATFFTIGNQIDSYSDAVIRANEMGCEVCTHSWDHADGSGQGVDLTLMSADEQIEEVTQGYAAIAKVLGKEPTHIMRAPGGNFHGSIIDTLWPYLDAEIGWDVDTEDWALPGADAIAARILSVQPGQVILMHDGGGNRAQTVEALRTALPELVARGYKCVTVSELLTYHNNGSQAATAETTTETATMVEG